MGAIDRSNYPGIPEDFPIEAQDVALAGGQPQLTLVRQGERYYAAGTSPQEVQEDYAEMLDLAGQLMARCQAQGLSTSTALESMLARESQIMQLHYGIRPSHATWVLQRVRTLLQEAGHPATGGGQLLQ